MAAESVEIVLHGVDNATPVMDKVTQKLVDNENKYISKLKEQLIAQTEGAEAAERFKLAEMGFSEEAINSAMALRAQIDASKEATAAREEGIVSIEKTKAALEETSQASINTAGVFSKIFGALGMGELKTFSDKMGGLKKEVENITEAGDNLGSAFKGVAIAGIAIGTAVAAFNVGKMIGEWIWQTEKWKEALKDALNTTSSEEQKVRDNLDEQFKLRMQIAQAAGDEGQKKQELEALQKKVQFDLDNQKALVKMAKEEKERAENSIWASVNSGDAETAKAQFEEENKKLDLLEKQLKTVKAITDPSLLQQQLNLRQKENEDAKKFEEERKQASDEAWADFKKKMDDQKKAQEDQQKKEDDYLAALQIRNEELMNGKRAADEMKASMAGISDEVILQGRELSIQNELLEAQKQLADEQKKKDEERQKAMAQPTAPLQAMQSRLLSRVSTGGGDRVAKASEKTAELTAEIEKLQREQLDLQKRRGVLELATVEGA